MTTDLVMAEIRRIREKYAEQFDGDVHAMMEDLRRRNAESNRPSVSREPKPRNQKQAPTNAA